MYLPRELSVPIYEQNILLKQSHCNIHLMDVGGNIMTENEGKSELLNAFFASVFNSKTSCAPGTQTSEPDNRDEKQKEAQDTLPIKQGPSPRLVSCYTI